MVLNKNNHFCKFFFLRQYRPRKCLVQNSRTKKRLSRPKKHKKFEKSKKCYFSKGVNSLFWSKNGHFFNFFFFRQYSPKKGVLRYSRWKKHLSRLKKTRRSKSPKISIFLKMVIPWFLDKNGHFCNLFFLGNTCHENVVYDILEQKNFFLGQKNNKFKKSKKLTFFQRG